MKTLFITSNSNPTKVQAIQNALAKLPVSDFYFSPISCDQEDHKPLSESESINALQKRAERLFESPMDIPGEVIAIEIQKGSNVHNHDEPLLLTCRAIVIAKDGSKISFAKNSVPLAPEIRSLVKEKNMYIYDAYEAVYGEKVKTKEISLYEYITGKSELEWFTDTVFKALLF